MRIEVRRQTSTIIMTMISIIMLLTIVIVTCEVQMMWCVFRLWKVLAFCMRWRNMHRNYLLRSFALPPITICTRSKRCTCPSSWPANYYLSVCHICMRNYIILMKTITITLTTLAVYETFEHTHDGRMSSILL